MSDYTKALKEAKEKVVIEEYKKVLEGKSSRFPVGFWDDEENAKVITRYLVEEVLKLSEKELKEKLSMKLFKDNKLGGMLSQVYSKSPFQAISSAYPQKDYKIWEFRDHVTESFENERKNIVAKAYKDVLDGKVNRFPAGFWDDEENAKIATRYLVEEVLKLSEKELKEQLSIQLFKQNKLGGMLSQVYSNSPFQAIVNAYPKKNYKVWEFNGPVPAGFWTDAENVKDAVNWLMKKEFKSSPEKAKKELTAKIFKDNGLGHLICEYFKESVFNIMNFVYPGQYNEWDFVQTSKGTWESEEAAIRATKWLIEEHLKLSEEELRTKLSYKLFEDNGLGGMVQTRYQSSPFAAVNAAYPGKYKEWEIGLVPNGYWNDINNGIKATKWLLEDKLAWDDEQIKKNIRAQTFVDNGLRGMLRLCFDESPYKALEATYPGRFQQWELKQVPRGFWDKESNRIEAIKWLVEKKLSLNPSKLDQYIPRDVFRENGLGGMLRKYYKENPRVAIESVYGNIILK